MTDRELLQRALSVLAYEPAVDGYKSRFQCEAELEEICADIRARLADGERQEPVAWRIKIGDSDMWSYTQTESDADFNGNASGQRYVKEPLFLAPPTAATIRAEAMEKCKEAARSVIESTEIPVDREGPAILAAIRKLAQEGSKWKP